MNKALETGVSMTIKGKQQTVYGTAVMWSGDNLGNHQIFGFSPTFNANLCCHFCYASHSERQNCFRESDVRLRTKASHEADCNRYDADIYSAKATGV